MEQKHYDFVIVGGGLFGATFAKIATENGNKCLIIEKKECLGGLCYSDKEDNINVHRNGCHIFHTEDYNLWWWINRVTPMCPYIQQTMATAPDGNVYNLPFNMNTFYQLWKTKTPEEARAMIEKQKFNGEPTNLEEQALSMVGTDIYELLIKGYTEKQWGRECKRLPSFIIKRLPLRFTYDNNYFNDKWQGVPYNGYEELFKELTRYVDVMLSTDFNDNPEHYKSLGDIVIYSGKIDEYFKYCYGSLDYRSVRFEHRKFDTENYQGCAVMNNTDSSVPYTRSIEHKHFLNDESSTTIVSFEYPERHDDSNEPCYPINDKKNNSIFQKYRELANKEKNVYFGGRLADYKYYDMDDTIIAAMDLYEHIHHINK